MEIRKAIVLLSNMARNHGQSHPWEPRPPKSAWCLTCMLLSCSECNKASHMRLLALVTSICRSWQPWRITNIFSVLGLTVLLPSHPLKPSLRDLHWFPALQNCQQDMPGGCRTVLCCCTTLRRANLWAQLIYCKWTDISSPSSPRKGQVLPVGAKGGTTNA